MLDDPRKTAGVSPPYRSVSAARVGAMVQRYLYLMRSSWPRLLEIVYWPTVQMLMWGFLQTYLVSKTGIAASAGGALIGAILLWDVLFRGQLGFSMSFLEEMWSRNIGNLMISPLRPGEFIAALMAMSVIRMAIGLVPVSLFAMLYFGFNLWGLGLGLAAFFANLFLTAWAIAVPVSGMILRNGLGAEGFAWSLAFLLLPLTAVFYPVDTLPSALEAVAWALPPTYVFEGLRALVFEERFEAGLMVRAFALNAVYLTGGCLAFYWFLRSSRRVGSILQVGE
jgi:ABC-2 type transport system permease protein